MILTRADWRSMRRPAAPAQAVHGGASEGREARTTAISHDGAAIATHLDFSGVGHGRQGLGVAPSS